MTSVASLPPPSPRDAEIRAAVMPLVEACAWNEAAAIVLMRLSEIRTTRQTHIESVFLQWCDLPPDDRPDFLTYAHKRRDPAVGVS